MTHAYADIYVSDAQNNLGDMMDYAVTDCGYNADAFFALFISSGVAGAFEIGNPKFIAGMSGPELACEVVLRTFGKQLHARPSENTDKSPEYWAGWALAYCQWFTGHNFATLHKALPFSELLRLYPTLHEADVQKFVAVAIDRLAQSGKSAETKLGLIRKARGFSQRQLAEAAGVTLRMVQLYEQRQNDIHKAQAGTLLRLAHALGCKIDDLLD